jgi:anti-sigma factor (TIGR02949 family)
MQRPLDDALACEEALDLLEPYLDGDLPPEEADRVRRHLEGCASCAAELSMAARIQRELRALPQPECPPEVLERVRRAGRGQVVPFPTGSRPLRSRIAAVAALLALAVGGGSLFVHLQNVQQQQREQVAQATQEARLALAYFGKVTRRTGLDVRDEVLEKRLVIPVTRSVSRSLGNLPNAPAAEPRKEL